MKYTDVELVILAQDISIVVSHLAGHSQDLPEPTLYQLHGVALARFLIPEVRYGIIGIPDRLGVPFSQYFSVPLMTNFKEVHLRYTSEGHVQMLYLTQKEKSISYETIAEELHYFRSSPESFYDYMNRLTTSAIKYNTPLSWDTQDKHRKIYLTKELLTNGQARDQQTAS